MKLLDNFLKIDREAQYMHLSRSCVYTQKELLHIAHTHQGLTKYALVSFESIQNILSIFDGEED